MSATPMLESTTSEESAGFETITESVSADKLPFSPFNLECRKISSSRVGRDFQVDELPAAGTYMQGEDEASYEITWNPKLAEAKGLIDFIHLNCPPNKKESALSLLHEHEYEEDAFWDALETVCPLDDSHWKEEEKGTFLKLMTETKHDIVKIAQRLGKSVSNCLTVHYSNTGCNVRMTRSARRRLPLSSDTSSMKACQGEYQIKSKKLKVEKTPHHDLLIRPNEALNEVCDDVVKVCNKIVKDNSSRKKEICDNIVRDGDISPWSSLLEASNAVQKIEASSASCKQFPEKSGIAKKQHARHYPDTSISCMNMSPEILTSTNGLILDPSETQDTRHCQYTSVSDRNVSPESGTSTNRLIIDPTERGREIASKLILDTTETTEGSDFSSDENNTSPTKANQRRVTRSASRSANRRIPPVKYNESPIENHSRSSSRSTNRRIPPVNYNESPIENHSRSSSRNASRRLPPVNYNESLIENHSRSSSRSASRRLPLVNYNESPIENHSQSASRRVSPVNYIESQTEKESPENEKITSRRQTRGYLKRELVGTFDRAKSIKRSKPEDSELEPPRRKKPPQIVWHAHYEALLVFKKEHGHCLIPKIHIENQPLSSWVFRQRAEYKKRHQNGGKSSYLTDERVTILEKQGFAWRTKCTKEQSALERKNRSGHENERWETFFSLLINYKDIHGNCLVPKIYRENQTLSAWVFKQRAAMKLRKEGKENRLTDGRVIKLNAVGFVWDAKSNKEWKELDQLKKQKQADILWDQHYNSLITYKRVTGHTRVPKRYKPNQSLSAWVFRQRSHHRCLLKKKPNSLTERRLKKLNQIEFQFEFWDQRQPWKQEIEK